MKHSGLLVVSVWMLLKKVFHLGLGSLPLKVCMQCVCSCSNPLISRPWPPRRRGEEDWRDRGQRWSRGFVSNRHQKDGFQSWKLKMFSFFFLNVLRIKTETQLIDQNTGSRTDISSWNTNHNGIDRNHLTEYMHPSLSYLASWII